MKLARDLFTSADGETWEWASIQGALAFLAFLIFSAYHYLILKNSFEPVSFGSGISAIGLGTGAHKLMSGKADNV